jgi:hypothetical protein
MTAETVIIHRVLRQMLWGLALVAIASGAGPGEVRSAEVSKRLEVPTTPRRLWTAVGGYCGLARWHPEVASCVEKRRGTERMRQVTLKDGGIIIDRLVGEDKKKQELRWVLLASPFPVASAEARLAIEDQDEDRDAAEDDDGTAVVWSATFTPSPGVPEDVARKALLRFFQAGLIGLKEGFRSKSGAD